MFLIFLVLISLVNFQPCFAAQNTSDDWTELAKRFSGGGSLIRNQSIKNLKAIPNLEDRMRKELLGSQRLLALDVIATLKLESLLPDLIRLSGEDDSGFLYLAMNSLVTPQNQDQLRRLYYVRVNSPHTSAPAKVVLLDTLIRMRVRLTNSQLQNALIQDPSSEVRSAALYYLRYFLVKYGDKDYFKLLPSLIKTAKKNEASKQWNTQLNYLLSELYPHNVRYNHQQLLESASPPKHQVAHSPEYPGYPKDLRYSKYNDIYRQKEIQVAVLFGYKDGRPARYVGDRYERAYFIDRLLKLGFTQADSNLTEDTFIYEASRGTFQPSQKLVFHVTHSSVSPDDVENRSDPFQKWRSEYARQVFANALQNADIILYNGHSRKGGGPDFDPPRCTRAQHVDYPWYQKTRPGLQRMLTALKGAYPGPKLLGLFSCQSDRHFSNALLESNKGIGLIVTQNLIYYSDALENMLETTRSLIQMRSETELRLIGARVLGFFDPQPKSQRLKLTASSR